MADGTLNNNAADAEEEDINQEFSQETGVPEKTSSFKWKYGGYCIFQGIRNFFLGEKKPKKNLNKFSDIAETLISTIPDDPNEELLIASGKLLEQQRILEDTRARRRLERWATRTIVCYLFAVFLLIIVNGIVLIKCPTETVEFLGKSQSVVRRGFITDSIMTVILSTTTINIIGLGVIVLKGHFDKNKSQDKK